MTTEATTPEAGGATSADPIDRIQAFLDASGGDGQQGEPQGQPETNKASSTDDSQDGVQQEGTEPQFTTDHLAQYLGIDPNQVDVDEEGQPIFRLKVDGEERTAKFSDFLADHQKRGAADKRLQQATERERAAERREQEAERAIQARFTEQQQSLQHLASLTQVLQQELNGEYQSINWDELWRTDAATARAWERKFQDRQARINGTMQNIAQHNAMAMQQAEAARKANEDKAKETQSKRLLELVPEWKDQAVFQQERQELFRWMESKGIDPQDVDLNKASNVFLLRKSWQQDTLVAKKPEVENKLRTAPKLTKPGASTAKPDAGKNAKLSELKRQARGNGRDANKSAVEWLVAKGIA